MSLLKSDDIDIPPNRLHHKVTTYGTWINKLGPIKISGLPVQLVRIQPSEDDFRTLRESGAYYVDKTEIIAEYLDLHFERAVMFARPRRFGKTLTMTMFRDFLDIRQDSREIFSGLKIMEHSDVVRKCMNQYPVIFLSLKGISGETFENVLQKMRVEISKVCEEHRYLMESPEVSPAWKAQFDRLINQAAAQANTEQALDLIA